MQSNTTYHPRGELVEGYPLKDHPLYGVWADMKTRCNNPKSAQWMDYGGRGITHCERWTHFRYFVEDMSPRLEGMQLDRRDNEIGYTKENCRWATRFEQAQNKRIYKTNKVGIGGVQQLRNGTFGCRYAKDGVRYNLGRFHTAGEAGLFRTAFAEALVNSPEQAQEMLTRRARLDSESGVRGITHGPDGFIVRKTMDGQRVYLGHTKDFNVALSMLAGAA